MFLELNIIITVNEILKMCTIIFLMIELELAKIPEILFEVKLQ